MITGDHSNTAQAIARELDILQPGDTVVVGLELDRMSDQDLAQRVSQISV
jgi:Ca2+-transporting ATPase